MAPANHRLNTLVALRELDMSAVMLRPNVDAGSEDVARGIRKFREYHPHENLRFYKNFPPEAFIRLMTHCACMVGNSSAAIRDGAYLGVPAVNVGTRQAGRERGKNVIDVGYSSGEIREAVQTHLKNGRYPSESIYGDGRAGQRIASILASLDQLVVQKRIAY